MAPQNNSHKRIPPASTSWVGAIDHCDTLNGKRLRDKYLIGWHGDFISVFEGKWFRRNVGDFVSNFERFSPPGV